MKRFWFFILLIIPVLSCNFLLPAVTPTVEIFLPSPLPPSTISPVPALPTFPSPTNEPLTSSDDPNIHGVVRIEGSPEFITQTRATLSLLESHAPDAYQKIQT